MRGFHISTSTVCVSLHTSCSRVVFFGIVCRWKKYYYCWFISVFNTLLWNSLIFYALLSDWNTVLHLFPSKLRNNLTKVKIALLAKFLLVPISLNSGTSLLHHHLWFSGRGMGGQVPPATLTAGGHRFFVVGGRSRAADGSIFPTHCAHVFYIYFTNWILIWTSMNISTNNFDLRIPMIYLILILYLQAAFNLT